MKSQGLLIVPLNSHFAWRSQTDSRIHGEAGVVGGLDAVRLLVELEHLVGVPAVRLRKKNT